MTYNKREPTLHTSKTLPSCCFHPAAVWFSTLLTHKTFVGPVAYLTPYINPRSDVWKQFESIQYYVLALILCREVLVSWTEIDLHALRSVSFLRLCFVRAVTVSPFSCFTQHLKKITNWKRHINLAL